MKGVRRLGKSRVDALAAKVEAWVKTSPEQGFEFAAKRLPELLGTEVQIGDKGWWMYAPGTIPVLMVAHMDTVQGLVKAPLYDQRYKVMSGLSGLGADDRAGVAAIFELLERGHQPHVLLTDGEEKGCIGAGHAADHLPAPPVHCMIEIDRMNTDDMVFYMCDNPEWEKYVEGFGFTKAFGTCTDISKLMPKWGIAGVNLSAGYFRQHTAGEYLRVDELLRTVNRVEQLLLNPPAERFPFREKVYAAPKGSGVWDGEEYDSTYWNRYQRGNGTSTSWPSKPYGQQSSTDTAAAVAKVESGNDPRTAVAGRLSIDCCPECRSENVGFRLSANKDEAGRLLLDGHCWACKHKWAESVDYHLAKWKNHKRPEADILQEYIVKFPSTLLDRERQAVLTMLQHDPRFRDNTAPKTIEEAVQVLRAGGPHRIIIGRTRFIFPPLEVANDKALVPFD